MEQDNDIERSREGQSNGSGKERTMGAESMIIIMENSIVGNDTHSGVSFVANEEDFSTLSVDRSLPAH